MTLTVVPPPTSQTNRISFSWFLIRIARLLHDIAVAYLEYTWHASCSMHSSRFRLRQANGSYVAGVWSKTCQGYSLPESFYSRYRLPRRRHREDELDFCIFPTASKLAFQSCFDGSIKVLKVIRVPSCTVNYPSLKLICQHAPTISQLRVSEALSKGP